MYHKVMQIILLLKIKVQCVHTIKVKYDKTNNIYLKSTELLILISLDTNSCCLAGC